MIETRKSVVALTVLGCLLLVLNGIGLVLQSRDDLPSFVAVALLQGVVYIFAVWLVCRVQPGRPGLAVVLIVATLLRLSILFSPPFLSDDIYRYIWDGRVQAAGINPYRFVPDDEHLEPLRDKAIYPNINRSDYAHTIYPPLAQITFLLVTRISESVIWMKAAMVGFEAIAVWLLIKLLLASGLPPERVLIYAWSPLAVWEIAGSGHIDAVAVALLALALWARKRELPVLVGIALAGATLIKLYPVVLFPALYRRWDWKMPAAFSTAVMLAYAPYASVGAGVVGFLPGYFQEEGLQQGWGIFPLNVAAHLLGHEFTGKAYLVVAAAILGLLGMWFMFRRRADQNGYVVAAMTLALAFTVLLSPHYSWYFLWLLPMLCLRPYFPALFLTITSFVLYETHLQASHQVIFRINALLYLPFVLLVFIWWWISRSRPTEVECGAIESAEEHTK
jgi:alpha-1,6-mannosyltransferase